jgi:hypothetical protein
MDPVMPIDIQILMGKYICGKRYINRYYLIPRPFNGSGCEQGMKICGGLLEEN